MGKLFVFLGKSASGKDTLFQKIMGKNPQLKHVVSYTTRPIRKGEIEGREYHFVKEDTLRRMEREHRIVECRSYRTVHGIWYYFTADDGQIDFEQGDYCLISTLEGYEKIRDFYGGERVEPIYIEVDDFERISRALAREKTQQVPCVAEVCRRFLADETDFSEQNLQAAGIRNRIANRDCEEAICQIEAILKIW